MAKPTLASQAALINQLQANLQETVSELAYFKDGCDELNAEVVHFKQLCDELHAQSVNGRTLVDELNAEIAELQAALANACKATPATPTPAPTPKAPTLSKHEWKIQQGRIARGEAVPAPRTAYVAPTPRTGTTDAAYAEWRQHCLALRDGGAKAYPTFQSYLAAM